jgi:hypothetical protein
MFNMFNHAMYVAAFGIVAYVLVFVHPASPAGRASVQQAAAHTSVAAGAAAADAPSLAASK